MSEQGLVFDMHRGTLHDGPGMRTTVFFKGCPLRCKWCHNPESLKKIPQIQWNKKKCIGCLRCKNACSNEGIELIENAIKINQNKCKACYRCVESCPAKAMTCIGTYMSEDEIVKEVCKDAIFFEEFGGGITISGGEPLVQYPFVKKLLSRLKNEGKHTALDTCGYAPTEHYEKLYPYVDVFLYDLKIYNEGQHKLFTGVSNKMILDNLIQLIQWTTKDVDKKIWIRTPLIPGATANEKNIQEIGQFLAQYATGAVERWELCTFNNVCKDKYRKLDQKWEYEDETLLREQEVHQLERIAKVFLGDQVIVSGLMGK